MIIPDSDRKLKKYVTVAGILAVVLLLLLFVPFLWNKTSKNDFLSGQVDRLKMEKEKKLRNDMDEVSRKMKEQPYSEEKIREDMSRGGEELKGLPATFSEDMQKAADDLNKSLNNQ